LAGANRVPNLKTVELENEFKIEGIANLSDFSALVIQRPTSCAFDATRLFQALKQPDAARLRRFDGGNDGRLRSNHRAN